MEVLLWSVYGAATIPLRIGQSLGGIAEVLNMFKVSTVPPPRSAVLTVFRGAAAINNGTTAEPLRNHGDHGGATAVYVVQAPQWHRSYCVTGVVATCSAAAKTVIRPKTTSHI